MRQGPRNYIVRISDLHYNSAFWILAKKLGTTYFNKGWTQVLWYITYYFSRKESFRNLWDRIGKTKNSSSYTSTWVVTTFKCKYLPPMKFPTFYYSLIEKVKTCVMIIQKKVLKFYWNIIICLVIKFFVHLFIT